MIDDINVNASHFLRMTKEKAIEQMIKNGFVPGKKEDQAAWAGKAYDFMKKKVEEDKVEEQKNKQREQEDVIARKKLEEEQQKLFQSELEEEQSEKMKQSTATSNAGVQPQVGQTGPK